MAEEQSGRDEAAEAPVPEPGRRRKVHVLLAFLAVFVLLIVVFNDVLFPFLMAMYIAYLVEPIVRAVTLSRLFGLKWTRGPTIVTLYVLVLGGLGFLGWVGITKLARTIKTTSQSVARSLEEEGHKATFKLPPLPRAAVQEGEAPRKPLPETGIVIPKDTRLLIRGGEYATLYRIRVTPEERQVSVLLEHVDGPEHKHASEREPEPAQLKHVMDLTNTNGEKVSLADIARLEVTAGGAATGLEYYVERAFISPIVENLADVGFEVEPTLLRDYVALQGLTLREDLPETIGKGALKIAGKLVFSVYEFFLILMLTAFIVMDRREIARFFASLPPPRHKAAYQKLMRYVDDGLAGVIRGQLVICGVNGVLTYVGLLVFGVPYALTLASVAAVLSLIPVFGTIVSSIPIVLVGATKGLDTALFALGWIVMIHVLEANIFNPMIMGSHARMHPVVIIFSLLAGEHAFGIWGALLAVPTMSLIQSCFRFYRHEIEHIPEDRDHGGDGGPGGWISAVWAKFKARISGTAAPTEAKAGAAADGEAS
jgi:predicted PurR-regulated permease PerM